jgi:hypothetical protein
MGKTNGAYKAEFEVGTSVQISDRDFLEEFSKLTLFECCKQRGVPLDRLDPENIELNQTWKLHHQLEPAQFNYCDQVAVVEEVSYYHGADELYRLAGIPGI